MTRWLAEPNRDPRLGDALRRSQPGGPPAADDRLRLRVLQAARPTLARLRQGPASWWQWTAAWARVAVPLGLAASLAAGALLVRGASGLAQSQQGSDTETARTLVVGLAAGSGAAPQLTDALVAQASDDWLLGQVMSR